MRESIRQQYQREGATLSVIKRLRRRALIEAVMYALGAILAGVVAYGIGDGILQWMVGGTGVVLLALSLACGVVAIRSGGSRSSRKEGGTSNAD